MALNKRQKAILAATQPGKVYSIDDALKILKDNSKAKFVEAIDVAVRLGVDAKKSDQQVRGSTVLPAGTGKSVRVAVFAPAGAKADEALAAGAEAVGMDDLAEKMIAGDLNYDVVIAMS
jgi:large subunit ribosomal protein L1